MNTVPITAAILKQMSDQNTKPNMKVLAEASIIINQYADKHGINTPLRMAHFLAQIVHETDNFRIKEENLSKSAQIILRSHSKQIKTLEEAKKYEYDAEGLAARVYELVAGSALNNKPQIDHS